MTSYHLPLVERNNYLFVCGPSPVSFLFFGCTLTTRGFKGTGLHVCHVNRCTFERGDQHHCPHGLLTAAAGDQMALVLFLE